MLSGEGKKESRRSSEISRCDPFVSPDVWENATALDVTPLNQMGVGSLSL